MGDEEEKLKESSSRLSFFEELKRRKVMRVGITYAVVAWIIIQVASSTFGWFDIPKWAFQFVVIMLVTFFPVSIILAWAFELTPDGIKTTKTARDNRGVAPASEEEHKRRNLKAVVFAAALPTLIFGSLAIFFFFRVDPPVSPDVPGGRSSSALSSSNGLQVEDLEKSIAVLPLENMSPDPDNAFFAKGVHEDILTHLSRIAELKVISRTSTLQFADAQRNLSDIGTTLGVRYVVEGSVRRAEGQVRVTVQLIDAKTDEHLWAENYDRELKDIFTIQSEIAKQIASTVHATISPEESERIDQMPTANLLAYDNYVRGRELVWSIDTVQRSREFFEKALEHDPDFALAHLGMANYYAEMVFKNYLPTKESFPKTEEWLRSAEALDHDNLSEVKRLSGLLNLWYKWDWASALNDFEVAIAANRNSNSIGMLAWNYVVVGNFEKAVESIQAAVELDPLNLQTKHYLSQIYYHTGNYEKSVGVCLSILDADSNSSEAHRTLANNYNNLGRIDEAIESAKKAVEMQQGKSWSRSALASAYIAAGRKAEALEIIDAMLKDERAVYVPKVGLAALYFAMGEIDEGFDWLEQSYESREHWLPAYLNNPRSHGETLRADPRFQNMVDRMDFPE